MHVLSGGARIHIVGQEFRDPLNLHLYIGGYDPHVIASYADYYGALNPWSPVFAMLPVGRPTLARTMCSHEKMEKTEFYADWIVPQGDIIDGGGAVLFRDASRYFAIGGNIARKDTDRLERDWMELLGLITPHIQQSLEINRTLVAQRLQSDANILAPDATRAAVIALGHDGVILHANATAEARLERRSALRREMGRLVLADSRMNDRLQFELASLYDARSGPPIVFRLPTVDGPLLCRAIRLWSERCTTNYLSFVTGQGAPTLLLVLEPDKGTRTPPSTLEALGLTRGESAVVGMLVQGLSPAQIADTREVSLHTVRNQIKSAMGKSGVSRQSALVSLAIRSGAPPS